MWRPWYSYLVALVTIGIVTPITSEWECLGAPMMGAPANAPMPVNAPMPPPPQ